jgi:hypothetical protein
MKIIYNKAVNRYDDHIKWSVHLGEWRMNPAMKVELSQLVEHFSSASFQVQGVYHYRIAPKQSGCISTAPFPGFIFPLSGRARFVFEGIPYLAGVGNVVHGGANMRLDKVVLSDTPWEYILVLYQIRKPEPEGLDLESAHF